MTNTSATGGYLAPSSTSAAYDEAFDRQLSALVRGLTGLADGTVRPRWQTIPPKALPVGTDWCAIGVTEIAKDYGAAVIHRSAGLGSDELQRHETVTILASFYGPAAQGNAARMADGLWVAQNRDAMRAAGMGLYEASGIRSAPEFANQQWIRRFDLSFMVRREVDRVYPILNLLSAQGSVHPGDGSSQPFIVTEN